MWNDTTNGIILQLAKGENGITQLGLLLSNRSEESELIIQAIGERLSKLETKIVPDNSKELKDKDDEIAKLKAELAKKETTTDIPPLETKPENNDVVPPVNAPLGLTEAREKYKDIFGKVVPVNKKNNLEWILSKL